MDSNDTSRLFLGGVGLWVVAVLVALPFGVLNSLLNPFLWLSSFMEGIEGVVYLVSGGSLSAILSSYGTSAEATQVVVGWVGMVAWLGTIVAYYVARQNNESILLYVPAIIPLPILPLALAIYRMSSFRKRHQAPSS
ncbi:hypothetical protein [Halarchaeum salinum]|uniref:hypothetical protein n=1 Tax=Halarchaeum salinum TaxID=489912 RepID=UPI001B88612B